ncbi:MAG: hypothetical protein Q9163_001785 [Psora crenata]
MSFLTSKAIRPTSPYLRLSLTATRRPFHSTLRLSALSESDHSVADDVRKKAIDEHKNDQIEKQKEGKGHWKRELGSNSETAIKADREEITDAEQDISALQKETSGAMEKDHEHGKK